MKLFLRLIFLIIIAILISYVKPQQEPNCIPDKNCPYNQGECSDDQCSCKDGFYTVLNRNMNKTDQIFCNYKQISSKLMLLFEVLVPGSGHLYSRRWILGGIKLGLLLLFITITCVTAKKKILIPKCCLIIQKAFIGLGKDNKDGGKGDKDEKERLTQSRQSIQIIDNDNDDNAEEELVSNKEGQNEVSKGNNSNNIKIAIRDCMAFEELSKDSFGGESPTQCDKFKQKLTNVIIYIFWIAYALDIYLIFFKIYPDGKGIPYGD